MQVRTTVLERQRVAEATPAPPGGQVPEWFADTWKAKNMGRQFTSTFLKETGIFVAATFCMEGEGPSHSWNIIPHTARSQVLKNPPACTDGLCVHAWSTPWCHPRMYHVFSSLTQGALVLSMSLSAAGVEAALNYVRGRKDPFHRVMGGVAAGGLLSLACES